MWRETLAQPQARRAYVMTKVGVFGVAALATIPLAHFIGPKAWIGLGAFGLVLAVMIVVVLAVARTPPEPSEVHPANDDEEAESDPSDPVVVEAADSLDLHSFPPADIPDVVTSYLEMAIDRDFGEVRLIHGRGIGVQRERVRSLLARHPDVISFDDAPPGHGGWGATIARLRRSR
jgi:hypothetical protein